MSLMFPFAGGPGSIFKASANYVRHSREKRKFQARWNLGLSYFMEQKHCQLAIFALCRPKSKTLLFIVISELLTRNNSNCTSNMFLSLEEGNQFHSPADLFDVVCPVL